MKKLTSKEVDNLILMNKKNIEAARAYATIIGEKDIEIMKLKAELKRGKK